MIVVMVPLGEALSETVVEREGVGAVEAVRVMDAEGDGEVVIDDVPEKESVWLVEKELVAVSGGAGVRVVTVADVEELVDTESVVVALMEWLMEPVSQGARVTVVTDGDAEPLVVCVSDLELDNVSDVDVEALSVPDLDVVPDVEPEAVCDRVDAGLDIVGIIR